MVDLFKKLGSRARQRLSWDEIRSLPGPLWNRRFIQGAEKASVAEDLFPGLKSTGKEGRTDWWNGFSGGGRLEREQGFFFLVLTLFIVVCLIYLGSASIPRLLDQIDGQYAGAAREMMARNDWLIPTQDGVPRLEKPPLVYWFEILSLRCFGLNDFAARLPTTLAAIGWFCVTGWIGLRLTGRRLFGVVTALILATFAGAFFFCHLIMPEPWLALFMALTMLSLIRALQCSAEAVKEKDWWLVAAWVFIAFGSLSKGLHALVFPILVIGLSALFKPATRSTWRRFLLHPYGFFIFLLLLAPWYLAVEHRYPGFLRDQLINEQIGHVFNHRWPRDTGSIPWRIFLPEHLLLLFPWSLFLPVFGAYLGRIVQKPKAILAGEWHVPFFWFVINLAAIGFSSIQDYYTLISWPICALITASCFLTGRRIKKVWYLLSAAAFLLVGAAGVYGTTLAGFTHQTFPGAKVDTGPTVIAAIQSMSPIVWRQIDFLLCINSIGFFLSGIVLIVLALRANRSWMILPTAAAMGMTFICGALELRAVQSQFSSARIADLVRSSAKGEYMVVSESEANDRTSLFFYLPHPVRWVNANPKTEFATRTEGIGQNLYLDERQIKRLWSDQKQVFLIISSARLGHWTEVLGLKPIDRDRIGGSGNAIVLLNRR